MLSVLPAEVWTNPNLKWLDPATKSGVFLREVARKLMDTLATAIPDEDERREHIFKNMLYGLPTTELTALVSRRTVYYTKDADHEHFAVVRMGTTEGNIPFIEPTHTFKNHSCIQCGAPDSLERGETRANYAYPFIHPEQLPQEFTDMKFDVIVGNPPYQMSDGGHGSSASPIYQKFVEAAVNMDPKFVLMIVPSRWFAGGKGLDKFRARMIDDRQISRIVDYPDATDCFPGVKIRGGVSYFLWQSGRDGDCLITTKRLGHPDSTLSRRLDEYDIFVRSNEAIKILEKVRSLGEQSMQGQVSQLKPFGFRTFFRDYAEEKRSENDIPIFIKSRKMAWVDRDLVVVNQDLIPSHKVLMHRAYGEEGHGPFSVVARPFVAPPDSCCTETYLVMGAYKSGIEADNLVTYIRSRFVRFLVSIKMQTQDISKSRFAFVPQLDMNISWTDDVLYKRYGFSDEEIVFIESQIKKMPA